MTITIRLPVELETDLRRRLALADVALSEFVRQAIAEKLEREPKPEKPSAYALWQKYSKSYGSRETDRSERVEEILGEIFDDKHRRR